MWELFQKSYLVSVNYNTVVIRNTVDIIGISFLNTRFV